MLLLILEKLKLFQTLLPLLYRLSTLSMIVNTFELVSPINLVGDLNIEDILISRLGPVTPRTRVKYFIRVYQIRRKGALSQ